MKDWYDQLRFRYKRLWEYYKELQLQKVLCDVESVIYSRPLVYMSEDDIEEALTPFHLMYERNILRNNMEANSCFDSEDIKKRVIYLKNLINDYR